MNHAENLDNYNRVVTYSNNLEEKMDLNTASLVLYLIGFTLLAAIIWFVFMGYVRSKNFNKDGSRKFPVRGTPGEVRSSEIQYHNQAIYRDFEFFYKITLAILGGTALLLTTADPINIESSKVLIQAGGGLQGVSGLLFAFFILAHQKSKAER